MNVAKTAHERWVAQGKCPAVDWAKTWCNDDKGHAGPHWARRIPTPSHAVGPTNPDRVTWTGGVR